MAERWSCVIAVECITFVFFLYAVQFISTSEFQMTTYNIPSMCGAHIHLKWKNIYTAELVFSSQRNTSLAAVSKGPSGPPYSLQGSCDITVESWDFLNKLMVRFEEFSLTRSCSDSSLELIDGLTEMQNLQGLPRPICGHHQSVVMSRSFLTSDKYLTIRIRGNSFLDDSMKLKLYITAFHEGICRSYEYPCANDRCIMAELTCNGYNPCGDNSDCPLPVQTKVTLKENSRSMFLPAVISLSVIIVIVIVGAGIVWRCYHVRRKRWRQSYSFTAGVPDTFPNGIEDRSANYQRSDSQIEAESRFAPPSYNSLPVYPEEESIESRNLPTLIEQTEDETNDSVTCSEPDSLSPPAYNCVMKHKDVFKVSTIGVHVEDQTDVKS